MQSCRIKYCFFLYLDLAHFQEWGWSWGQEQPPPLPTHVSKLDQTEPMLFQKHINSETNLTKVQYTDIKHNSGYQINRFKQIDRQRQIQIERQMHSQLGRQLDRKVDKQICRSIDVQINRQVERQIGVQIIRQIPSQLDRQIVDIQLGRWKDTEKIDRYRQKYRCTDSQVDSQLDRQRQKDRRKESQIDRQVLGRHIDRQKDRYRQKDKRKDRQIQIVRYHMIIKRREKESLYKIYLSIHVINLKRSN